MPGVRVDRGIGADGLRERGAALRLSLRVLQLQAGELRLGLRFFGQALFPRFEELPLLDLTRNCADIRDGISPDGAPLPRRFARDATLFEQNGGDIAHSWTVS